MSRIKLPKLNDQAAFSVAVDEVARNAVQIDYLTAQCAKAVQAAQARFNPYIEALQKQQNALLAQAEKFAEAHREELLPGKTKSTDTPLATYGFRTGMPQLKTLSKWNFTQVLDALVAAGLKMTAYVRTKKEIDKEAILAAAARGSLTTADLSAFGLKVVQEESFYIEPKVDGPSQVTAAAAK
jgi:phage host-nuclease inhibitor protein Gam